MTRRYVLPPIFPMLLLALMALLALTGCRKAETLLSALDQQQANEVAAVLLRHDIATQKVDGGKAGYSISVDAADFPQAVDWLKTYDLPSRPRVEIAQMFPSDSLVASPRAERARLYSAIEQRLEQSVRLMSGVLAARVHVSYDVDAQAGNGNGNRNGDGKASTSGPHVSAVVVYQNGMDATALINDIRRFLKNSFDDVRYENISVVLSQQPVSLGASVPMPVEKRTNEDRPLWPFLVLGAVVCAGIAAALTARVRGGWSRRHDVAQVGEG